MSVRDENQAPQIYVTCDIGAPALERLSHYRVEVHQGEDAPSRSELMRRLASGLLAIVTTIRDPIDEEVLVADPGTLEVIGQYAVGVDNIDLEAAARRGIPVVHTPDVLTDATAEFALFMMGCLARKLYPSERLVREKRWVRWHPSLPFLGDEVTGQTLGIVGLGRIGKSMAVKAAGLDMDILAHSRTIDDAFVEAMTELYEVRRRLKLTQRQPVFRVCSLEECLAGSDFLSLHVPLNEQTRGLIDEQALGRMKPSAYLINTTRGPVVDESALYQALRSKQIAGAALDVYDVEPLPGDSPLLDPDLEDRLRLFHHIGSGTYQTRLSPDPDLGMAGRCVQGVLDVLENRYEGDPQKMPFVANKLELRGSG